MFTPESAGGAELRKRLKLGESFVAMYAGNLGVLQDIETLIEAARALTTRRDIKIIFVGSGALERKVAAAATGLTNVIHLPQQELKSMPALIAASNVQIMSLVDHPLFEFTIPSKLQFATACARPVLAAMRGEAADLVAGAGAGIVVPPRSPGHVASAIAALADLDAGEHLAMRERSRTLYDNMFSEAVGATELVKIVESVSRDR